MTDPFKHMGLAEEATPSEVRERFKELSKTQHPDVGGNPEAYLQLREAKDEALRIAKLPRKCPGGCDKGKVAETHGFVTNWKSCPTCEGKGKVVLE